MDLPPAERRRRRTRPVTDFVRVEAAGGVLLLLAAAAALLWANSPWSAGYEALWRADLAVEVGPVHLGEDLLFWVNDGLMALFFFVVGLEIKGELVRGQLSDRRAAALPAIAALGGMVVPAAIFLAINVGSDGATGWGIPIATDIAFAVGVLALLGDRIPGSLKVLVLGLAIADDIGAVVVIAVVYTDRIALGWLVAAAGGLALFSLLHRSRFRWAPAYIVVATTVWLCTVESGAHATAAGVALGLLTPARPLPIDGEPNDVAHHLEVALHPWTSRVVIPLFALANIGIPLRGDLLGDAATSSVTIGVVAGLVVGKLLGVSAFAWLAVRLGLGRLPADVSWRHVLGMAAIAGMGFTVSIFVAGLAYEHRSGLEEEAKIGVLVASLLAAVIGSALLWARSGPPETDAGDP